MPSDAQKRANAKYQKEKVQSRIVKFYPTETDLLEHLDAQPNKAGYIKQLIREDIKRHS